MSFFLTLFRPRLVTYVLCPCLCILEGWNKLALNVLSPGKFYPNKRTTTTKKKGAETNKSTCIWFICPFFPFFFVCLLLIGRKEGLFQQTSSTKSELHVRFQGQKTMRVTLKKGFWIFTSVSYFHAPSPKKTNLDVRLPPFFVNFTY